MNLFSYVLIGVYILQALSILVVVFVEKKSPLSTLSWILVLTFLPVLGFIFYIFFGRDLASLNRNKFRALRRLQEDLKELFGNQTVLDQINSGEYSFSDPVAAEYISLIKLSTALCYTNYSQNNDLEIFVDARKKYECLFEDIENAKTSIHMVYFIISDTDISHQLIKLLAKKASQGVEVRLIYDELGNFVVPSKMFNIISRAGGEVHKFFPLTFRSILHANYRNHHKIVVIDGRIGYTGGMNIGDEYMGLHPRKTPWRDTHMRIIGESVNSLQALFLLDLTYVKNSYEPIDEFTNPRYFPKAEPVGNIGMHIVNSGPDDSKEAIKRLLIHIINSAKKTLYIQTPYLMPDQPLMEAIQNAALSGVKVILMLPGVPDKRIPYLVTYSYIQNMLDYGVEVHLYEGFLHAKSLVADDSICTLGTTNLDMRSLSLHFEVNNIIYNSRVAKDMAEVFQVDLTHCSEMTLEKYNSRSTVNKLLEKIFRLFAPLL